MYCWFFKILDVKEVEDKDFYNKINNGYNIDYLEKFGELNNSKFKDDIEDIDFLLSYFMVVMEIELFKRLDNDNFNFKVFLKRIRSLLFFVDLMLLKGFSVKESYFDVLFRF